MSNLPAKPWRELPSSVAGLIAPELPALRDEILEVIAAEVPDYARPLEGSFGRGIRLGVDEALRQFVDLVEDPDRGRAQSREIYLALGRGELREGRSLDALQAAYRIGARVAWRRLAEAGLRARLDPPVLCRLADAIFAYIDELAGDSVEGYAQAQEAAAGQRERRRRQLLTLLVAETFDQDAVTRAAADAGWQPPRQVAALACAPEDVDPIARRLPPEALGSTIDDLGCIVVPDPAAPGHGNVVAAACGGRTAVLGPARSLADARASWQAARSGLAAVESGALPNQFLSVEDHLAELALFESRHRLRELALRRLAPLDPLTAKARERMVETLKTYLAHRGNAAAMATSLHLHPQTVRYRLRHLRELLGDTLDDPDARFELELAIRAS